MNESPAAPLHRVLAPLNFERGVPGKPVCGDVKWITVDGIRTAVLRAPRPNKPVRGVSFFAPSPAHDKLGEQPWGCAVTPIRLPLPEGLLFQNDGPLELMYEGDDEPTVSGEHWELYPAQDMHAAMFVEKFQQLQDQMLPCKLIGGARPAELRQVDKDYMPSDRLSYVAVEALDSLAASAADSNTRQFSSLFANHLRATDMPFEQVLEHGNMSEMVATALQGWTAGNSEAQVSAWKALQKLGNAMEFKPESVKYNPYWAVHPFEFLDGVYSDELYDREVKTCAQAYIGDQELKGKVGHVACEMLTELKNNKQIFSSRELEHDGLTIKVHCAPR